MSGLRSFVGTLVVVAIATAVFADTHDPLPVTVERLDDKVLLVRSGEQYFDAVLVLASERGLVVIDTGIAPSFTRTYRKTIEESLGRSDFAFVINTHSHFDHVDGNQVFPEGIVIASETARERMVERNRDLSATITSQSERVANWTRQAAAAAPDSPQRLRFSNLATLYGQMVDDLKDDFVFVPPAVTFDDRMTLHLGDMTAHLYCYGPGTHVGDDVIVQVPEVGLVAVGDLFGPRYVQVLERNEPGVDLEHKLGVLDAVLADEKASRIVINGHGARMTRAELVMRRDYLSALTQAAKEEVAIGGTLAGLQERVPLDSDELAFLRTSDIPERQLAFEHQNNLRAAWMITKGLDDAAALIGRVVREKGAEAAREELDRILPLRDERYFIDEDAMNRLGYALLGEGRTDDAVEVFKMNVRAFPDSWNVYDSLGEALAAQGDVDQAISSYERSLQLNPGNTNAVGALERLREGAEGPGAQR